MANFSGSYLKLQRAREHLSNLKQRVEDLRKPDIHFVPVKREGTRLSFAPERQPGSHYPWANILVGEFSQQLRSSLNYIAVEVGFVDSGTRHRSAQFPIDDFPEDFNRHRKTYLRGVKLSHIADFERLQPYKGCDWTKRLREISNDDKHWDIVPVTASFSAEFSGVDPKTNERANIFTADTVKVEYGFAGTITFANGSPVIETLEILQSQVAHTLDEFKAMFA